MPPKKIKLKSSINAINSKSVSNKKKALPKLKAILANPYKPKFEPLVDNELSHLQELMFSEIKSSGISGRLFAKQNNIHLGLESCLRTIKNKNASCVIISQTIKPKFIINQIGYFAKQSNRNTPVFVVSDWETISEKLFGVKALIVVFPLNVTGDLGKWISKQTPPSIDCQKPGIEMEVDEPTLSAVTDNKKVDLSSLYLIKKSNGTRCFVPETVVKTERSFELETKDSKDAKDWTGDFISFTNDNENVEEPIDMHDIDEEFKRKQNKAIEVLQKIANKNKQAEDDYREKQTKKQMPSMSVKNTQEPVVEEWECDKYIPLEVHKIQPNPKRKPKKKRKNKNTKAN